MDRLPRAGEVYRHFKGGLYRIITLAVHSETGEQLVIYQALYGTFQVYARPLSLFVREVDQRKYPDAAPGPRFTLIPDGGARFLMESGERPQTGQEEADPDEPERGNPAVHSENSQEEGGAAAAQAGAGSPEEEGEEALDPRLLAFLEADSYRRKLEIFGSLAGRADEHMLNTIAVSLDLELSGDTVEEQYEALKNCMLTLERYECTRLR